uniref:Ovule protein n=1 Tax=Loa loa TaxID=7209 RepID=A0A1I7W320_LOALO
MNIASNPVLEKNPAVNHHYTGTRNSVNTNLRVRSSSVLGSPEKHKKYSRRASQFCKLAQFLHFYPPQSFSADVKSMTVHMLTVMRPCRAKANIASISKRTINHSLSMQTSRLWKEFHNPSSFSEQNLRVRSPTKRNPHIQKHDEHCKQPGNGEEFRSQSPFYRHKKFRQRKPQSKTNLAEFLAFLFTWNECM